MVARGRMVAESYDSEALAAVAAIRRAQEEVVITLSNDDCAPGQTSSRLK